MWHLIAGMPFTLLAHQAPVLPLKLWKPRWFCGTALVVGSMAPDLEYFFLSYPDPVRGHTLPGLLLFCLPVTLVLVGAVRLVARPLAAHLPDAGPLHLRDLGVLGIARRGPADLLRASVSALIGSGSHLFLDACTHCDGAIVTRVALLRVVVFHFGGRPFPVYRLLQYGGSLALLVVSLWIVYRIGSRRLLRRWYDSGSVPAMPARPRLFWGIAFAVAALGFSLRLLHDDWFRFSSAPVFWGHAVLQGCCYLFIGVCVAALVVTRPRRAAPPAARRLGSDEAC